MVADPSSDYGIGMHTVGLDRLVKCGGRGSVPTDVAEVVLVEQVGLVRTDDFPGGMRKL